MVIEATSPSLSIAFSARWWSFISSTRIFVTSLCGHLSGDAAFSNKVAMVVHELLENAVKYSIDPDQLVRCELVIHDALLTVRVENQASREQLSELTAAYDELRDADPLSIYITKMTANVEDRRSQMGLARIRYEGEAELSVAIDGERAEVGATFTMPQKAGVTHA